MPNERANKIAPVRTNNIVLQGSEIKGRIEESGSGLKNKKTRITAHPDQAQSISLKAVPR